MGAPYNALRSMSVNRMRLQPIDDIGIGEVIENPRTTSISASSERRKSRLQSGASRETARRRARSIGAMQS
uniref:Uncharacterized protein n=1 Tax=Acrobeloides nanus TaxID=290746 RepID=A0A914DPZ7_9BILA